MALPRSSIPTPWPASRSICSSTDSHGFAYSAMVLPGKENQPAPCGNGLIVMAPGQHEKLARLEGAPGPERSVGTDAPIQRSGSAGPSSGLGVCDAVDEHTAAPSGEPLRVLVVTRLA